MSDPNDKPEGLRIRCRLFGCEIDNCICCHCGAWLYYNEIQEGPLTRPLWQVRYYWRCIKRLSMLFRVVPCDECKQPVGFRRKLKGGHLCSKQCDDNYLPF